MLAALLCHWADCTPAVLLAASLQLQDIKINIVSEVNNIPITVKNTIKTH